MRLRIILIRNSIESTWLRPPQTWGMMLVSALGALLVALIVSGLAAHPRIFRDAFHLRLRGSRHLEQADIHNRLSVWAAPFHLMIAITGAYFGLALPILGIYASAFHGGDVAAVTQTVFGDEPDVTVGTGPIAIAGALEQVHERVPGAELLYVTVHGADQPQRYVSIAARHPQRLVYAENYLFDGQGRFLRTDGFLDGALGKRIVYSIYRLHFGHFDGMRTKLLYGVLGLALTAVAVTGVNVWLARRRVRDGLNGAWAGIVWGLPLALTVAAVGRFSAGTASVGLVWIVMLLSTGCGLALRDEARCRDCLRLALAGALTVLVTVHILRFAADAVHGVALVVNLLLAALACVIALRRIGARRRHHAVRSALLPPAETSTSRSR